MKYLYLQSSLHNTEELLARTKIVFDEIYLRTGFRFYGSSIEEVEGEEVSIVYIATGGTAGIFKEVADKLKDPIILITSGTDNSLSAAMEVHTYFKDRKRDCRLLHGTIEEVSDDLSRIISAIRVRNSLRGMRLGLIGKPSDWLISTEVDYVELKQKLGIEIIEVEMKELLDEISVHEYPEDEKTKRLLAQGFDEYQMKEALYIYGAFDRIVQKYDLKGFSVRCFDLLTTVKNTGCIGLSLINSRGIYGGCEGDLPSLISMCILGEISGKPVFQCNPSRLDKNSNEIVFAHCTLPINMPEKYKLKTHFESGIGVAVAGEISKGEATVFKTSSLLQRKFISRAYIKGSLEEENLCRTQILVEADEGEDNFLNTPVGNHYLVTHGDFSGCLKEFFSLY